MRVHFFNTETEESLVVKAAIFIPGRKGFCPHKILPEEENTEFVEYDSSKLEVSYIGE